MKLKLADTSVAMIALSSTGMSGALIIRAQPPLETLRDYYESTWRRETPVGTAPRAIPDVSLSAGEQTVLELLARGTPMASSPRRPACPPRPPPSHR
jgi:hypothetical protein